MTTSPAFKPPERSVPGPQSPLPRFADVLREQLRATGLALRVPLMIAGAIGVVSIIAVVVAIVTEGVVINYPSEPSPFPGIIGALLPFAVWVREKRFGAALLWTLPVDRRQHALIKVLAGWLWLMGGVALYTLSLLVLTLVSDGRLLPQETVQVLGVPSLSSALLDPVAVRPVQWAPGPLIWAVPFAAATGTYLLTSAFALGIRYPIRWILGTALLFPALVAASNAASAALGVEWLQDGPARAVLQLMKGRYGLDALLTARTMLLDDRAFLTTGERVAVWFAAPDLGDWAIAVLLWGGAGLIALWMAASRHRERRRA